MAGLVPSWSAPKEVVDARDKPDKPGHDEGESRSAYLLAREEIRGVGKAEACPPLKTTIS
jgi:hypothetical protein